MKKLTFKVKDGKFLVNGKPEQIISGAIHYFRVLPELWEDRLLKARQCGLNTIETYMCWNLHEPREGKFDFSGMLEFEKFIQAAEKLGLMVIVRPGPYICAEWDFGGMPAWLLEKNGIKFRCMNKPFLKAVDRFYGEILPRLKKLQCTEGGPVIAMQVENEYGSFGEDKNYLAHIRDLMVSHGIDVQLFTSDGPGDHYLQGGTLPGLLQTVNFGSNPAPAFKKSREYRPEGPDFCMEFWNGWFDHWGKEHHTRNVADAAKTLDEMLAAGASVNFYMFHGGTNFGFWNGANNVEGKHMATVTSYDYDAPLGECGDPTDKYFAYQKIIAKYNPGAKFGTPAPSVKKAYGKVKLTECVSLFDSLNRLSRKRLTLEPEPMEHFGQNFGFIHYRTRLSGPAPETNLMFMGMHDRGQIFLDGRFIGVVSRNDAKLSLPVSVPAGGAQLDVLVENMGRINYSPVLKYEHKGIIGGVCICLQQQYDWETWTLPLDNLEKLNFGRNEIPENHPGFYKGTFEADNAGDTFLKVPGGHKGACWINGFNLGRYWEIGPQKTLYVPAPLLKKGINEIVVFELHGLRGKQVEFTDTPDLG